MTSEARTSSQIGYWAASFLPWALPLAIGLAFRASYPNHVPRPQSGVPYWALGAVVVWALIKLNSPTKPTKAIRGWTVVVAVALAPALLAACVLLS